MSNVMEKILRHIKQFLIKHSTNPRPTSSPYISGDGFRRIAEYIYDETGKCKASDIKENDIVFVKGDMLDEFLVKIHPDIMAPYILITHNSDRNINNADLALIDNKIIHWFAQNVCAEHPKLTPLPIGLENAHYANAGRVKLFKNVPPSPKRHRFFVNFNIGTNPSERSECMESSKRNPLADIVTERMNQKDYVKLMNSYQFIISPPGNGNDAHRTWEALYLGSVPVVKKSIGMEYFKNLGLPMVIVDDWSDIERIDMSQHEGNKDHEALRLDWWKNLIHEKKS